MNSLKELADAVDFVDVKLPSGRTATIESWTVRFPPADPPRLPDRTLKSTYTSKPLVDVDGHRVFGELAIVRWLAKNGWRGLWADTFHGKKFWSGMPHRTEHVEPPPQVRAMYDRITREKGSPSGCFDVVAWKADRIIWLEYKGARDRPNQNEKLWIDAALRAGVSEDDLFFIGDTTNTRRSGKTGSTGGAKTSSHRRNTLSYSDKLDRRTIRSALKNRHGWVVKSHVNGTVSVWPPSGSTSPSTFREQVIAGVRDIGYEPTVVSTMDGRGRMVIVFHTPETLAQAGRGGHGYRSR